MTRSALILVCVLGAAGLRAEEATQLDSNETLFSAMAAVNAALPNGSEVVRQHIAGKKIDCLSELRNFVDSHRTNGKLDWSPYISLALSSQGAPNFAPNFTGVEEPPDLARIEGFRNLLIRFYREAELDDLWRKMRPAYERELVRYRDPAARAILEANAYLRNATSGYMGRRFLVYLELLTPPNLTQTRSYRDDYFVVLTPSAQPQINTVRHGYLHYLLDPLTTKFAEVVMKKNSLIDFARGSASLDESYKSDFLLLATESLIRATESRMDRKPTFIQESLADGYVLTPFFGEALPAYEKQESAMRMYFPEMMATLDVKKESKRLDAVDLTVKPARAEAKVDQASEPAREKAELTLDEAEKLYASRELDKASETFRHTLEQTDKKPLHARAYYGMARIAALQKNPELAEQLFRKTLELSPDAHTRAWSQVFLGRLAEATATPQDAVAHYKAALAVEGASDKALEAAREGLRKTSP